MASGKVKVRNKKSYTYNTNVTMTVHKVGELTIVEFNNAGTVNVAHRTNYTIYNIAEGYGRPTETVSFLVRFIYNGNFYSTGSVTINTGGNVVLYVAVDNPPSGEFTISNVCGSVTYLNSSTG